jgi:hypothetical protein
MSVNCIICGHWASLSTAGLPLQTGILILPGQRDEQHSRLWKARKEHRDFPILIGLVLVWAEVPPQCGANMEVASCQSMGKTILSAHYCSCSKMLDVLLSRSSCTANTYSVTSRYYCRLAILASVRVGQQFLEEVEHGRHFRLRIAHETAEKIWPCWRSSLLQSFPQLFL